MSNSKHSKKKDWNLIVSIFCAFIASFALLQTCTTNRQLAKTNSRLTSVEYRPMLRITNPRILSYLVTTSSDPYRKNYEPVEAIGNLEIQLEIKLKFTVSNIGNSSAFISGWIIRDIQSSSVDLRKWLLSKKGIDTAVDSSNIFSHQYNELAPSDSTCIELTISPESYKNNRFTLHILLLYQNDLNQLYDTYSWTEFEATQFMMSDPKFELIRPNLWKVLTKDTLKMLTINPINNYSKVYTDDEMSFVKKHLSAKVK